MKKSYLTELKAAKNRKELSRLLGYQPKAVTSIIYLTPLDQRYKTFTIPKKSGGDRVIKAPDPKLKKLQQHLAYILYQCLDEIEDGRSAPPVSYGFRRGASLSANAKRHKRRRFVLNIDIEDFFPSFNFGRVRGYFLNDQNFQLAPEVATTIAQIACDGNALPQGSPCSPIISELIGQILDLRMLRLAKKYGVRYSRYADDITLSTNQRQFPKGLAEPDIADLSAWKLGDDLEKCVQNSGFKINSTKTRMQVQGSRQTVTGLVVNEKANIPCKYYRNARAMCDSLFTNGQYFKDLVKNEVTGQMEPKYLSSLNTLQGILNYIYSITQAEETRGVQEQRTQPRAIRSLYRRFLFFKHCIALEKPLIITEGKTDPIYLREAIKSRKAQHPALGKDVPDGYEFEIQFFNYEGQAHEIMDLGGGSGDLKSIPLDYLRNIDASKQRHKAMNFKPMKYPVILLVDNDDGLKPIASTIKGNFGTEISVSTSEDFYHVYENLYLVKTPEKNGRSCIEDLIPKKWRNVQLNGKKFSLKNKIDPNKQYGKEVFAKSVVKKNAAKIDFSGFDPLLERIQEVLTHHRSQQP